MSAAADAVTRSIQRVTDLRDKLRRVKGQAQVRSQGERSALATAAMQWYEHDSPLLRRVNTLDLSQADALFATILDSSERAPSRKGSSSTLHDIRQQLIQLRAQLIAAESVASASHRASVIPAFSTLTSKAELQQILTRRWQEAERCLAADAGLASMVMMGGLLEGLLMARVERLTDKRPVFTAKAAPKKDGKTLAQKEWTLHNYIEIAHELGWIGETARGVSVVLRDYRNYIHPYKELSDGLVLSRDDAAMLWTVVVTLADQIVKSV